MKRKKQANGSAGAETPTVATPEVDPAEIERTKAQIGALMHGLVVGNTDPAALRKFEKDYIAGKKAVDEARGKLGNLCKQAEEKHGINVALFKHVQKLKGLLPPEALAEMRTVLTMAAQLGLFDSIEQYQQDENTEANAASVKAAESQKSNGKSFPDAIDQTPSGGKLEAARAQGQLAGESAARRADNPYAKDTAEREAWNDEFDKATEKRMAANADVATGELTGANGAH